MADLTSRLFDYPVIPHLRRHGPRGYTNYESFKPWLRDEFTFQCAYYLIRERWYPNGYRAYSVEHLIPQITDPKRTLDYDNLIYACLRCNSLRQDRLVLKSLRHGLRYSPPYRRERCGE